MSKKMTAAELHAQLESENDAGFRDKLQKSHQEKMKLQKVVKAKDAEIDDLSTVVKVLESELQDANKLLEAMRKNALSGSGMEGSAGSVNTSLSTGAGQTAALLAAEKVRAKKEANYWGPVKQAQVTNEIATLKSIIADKDATIGDLNDHIAQLRRVCEQMADGIKIERQDNLTLQEEIEHLNKVFADIASDETNATNVLRKKERELEQNHDDLEMLLDENDALKAKLAEAEADNELMAQGIMEANDQLILFQQAQAEDNSTILRLQEQLESERMKNASLELQDFRPDERIMNMVSQKIVSFNEIITAKDAELVLVQAQCDHWREEAEKAKEKVRALEMRLGMSSSPSPSSSPVRSQPEGDHQHKIAISVHGVKSNHQS